MRRWLSHLPAVAVLASVAHAQDPPHTFDLDNKENVVASRLEGTWKAVNSKLNAYAGASKLRSKLTFTLDKSAIPDKVFRDLGRTAGISFSVYAVGRIKGLRDEEVPFFLTVLYGSPRVIWFRETNKNPFGDAESFNVMLAVGTKTENDVMFRGGDFNNQSFTAYERVAPAALGGGEYVAAVEEMEKALAGMKSAGTQEAALAAVDAGLRALGRARRALWRDRR